MSLLLLFVLAGRQPTRGAEAHSAVPHIGWPDFYSSVTVHGVVFTERMKELAGKRVRIRGHAVRRPEVPGGVLLSRRPFTDPRGVEETDVPFDAVAVFWRSSLLIPPVPARPTVEGVLRLGNRSVGETVVTVTLEDAVPVLPTGTEGAKRGAPASGKRQSDPDRIGPASLERPVILPKCKRLQPSSAGSR